MTNNLRSSISTGLSQRHVACLRTAQEASIKKQCCIHDASDARGIGTAAHRSSVSVPRWTCHLETMHLRPLDLSSAAVSATGLRHELCGATLLSVGIVAGAHRDIRPLRLPQCCSICSFEPGFREAVSQHCHLQRPSFFFYVHLFHGDRVTGFLDTSLNVRVTTCISLFPLSLSSSLLLFLSLSRSLVLSLVLSRSLSPFYFLFSLSSLLLRLSSLLFLSFAPSLLRFPSLLRSFAPSLFAPSLLRSFAPSLLLVLLSFSPSFFLSLFSATVSIKVSLGAKPAQAEGECWVARRLGHCCTPAHLLPLLSRLVRAHLVTLPAHSRWLK